MRRASRMVSKTPSKLTTKLETFYLSVSQVPPQMSLCIRRVFPEPSRGRVYSTCYPLRPFTPTLALPPPRHNSAGSSTRGRVFLVFPYIPERFFIKPLTISELKWGRFYLSSASRTTRSNSLMSYGLLI